MRQAAEASPEVQASYKPEPLDQRSLALALLACLLWGGNIVAVKIGYLAFPPLWSAGWRFLMGLIVVVLWAHLRKYPLRPARHELRPFLMLAGMFALQIITLNFGVLFTSPAYAVLLLNTSPLFANLLGHFLAYEQKLTPARSFGLALSFLGIALLVLGKPVSRLAPNPLLGNSLALLSGFLLAVRIVYTRWLVQNINHVKTVIWQMGLGLPFFFLPALLFEPLLSGPLDFAPLLALFYQGFIVAGVCFLIWTGLLRRHSAGTLGAFSFTIPVFGVILSALLLGEPLTPRMLLAAGFVLTGIAVTVKN